MTFCPHGTRLKKNKSSGKQLKKKNRGGGGGGSRISSPRGTRLFARAKRRGGGNRLSCVFVSSSFCRTSDSATNPPSGSVGVPERSVTYIYYKEVEGENINAPWVRLLCAAGGRSVNPRRRRRSRAAAGERESTCSSLVLCAAGGGSRSLKSALASDGARAHLRDDFEPLPPNVDMRVPVVNELLHAG